MAGGVTGRAAHRELGVAQCPLPPLCSPGSLGKSATYMLMLDVGLCCCLAGYVQYAGALGTGWRATDWCWADVTAAASPSAFHGQKGRRKKAPAARSGGTDRRSCRWCVITAAGALRSIICPGCCWPAGLRDAKRPKGGQLKAPTAEIPWTNQNVPNRGTRMGTISHRASWDTTASPSPGPRSGPMTYVGDEGHWANTRFSMDEWLVIEEAKKNQPGWDHAVKQKWIQPRELDPAVGYFAKQAVVCSPLMNGWICEGMR